MKKTLPIFICRRRTGAAIMSNSKTIIFTGLVCLAICCLALAEPQLCPDLAPNDKVDFADFAILADNWHKSGSSLQGDFYGDGTVDIYDLAQLADYWLKDYECKNADFNLDYKINFLDFAKFASAWLSDSSAPGWDAQYDLDSSGSVDIEDLKILSYRWLKTYPEPNNAFDAFKNALASGNIDAALTFVADNSKDRYSEIFQAIGSNLPGYAAGMGTLVLQSQDEDTAIYEMTHQDGSTTYSFPVVFIKNDDGNWKIYNF
jgi:hypothetical protein